MLCITGGYAVHQVRPDMFSGGPIAGMMMGFGFGGLLIAVDEMLKGFSLRAFSASTFGMFLGAILAWLVDRSQLFMFASEAGQWILRLCLFIGFGYIGMVLALRSNKEDFYLIIPFVRFASQSKPENLLLLDTSVIVDGRITDLMEANFLEGVVVVPRFVLKELQALADSKDPIKRAKGRRGLDMLNRIQRNSRMEVKIHEADVPEETEVDSKLLKLAHLLNGRLYTNDFNLGKICELQKVPHVNLNTLSQILKPVILPGEIFTIKIAREGKEKGQGVGYLPDGTMVVVNQAQPMLGSTVDVQVLSLHQTGAGVIVFADLKPGDAA